MGMNNPDPEKIAEIVVDTAFHIHRDVGPGLLESVYEKIMHRALEKRGLFVESQKPVSFECMGLVFDYVIGDSLSRGGDCRTG